MTMGAQGPARTTGFVLLTAGVVLFVAAWLDLGIVYWGLPRRYHPVTEQNRPVLRVRVLFSATLLFVAGIVQLSGRV
jgi:hypothetical protein